MSLLLPKNSPQYKRYRLEHDSPHYTVVVNLYDEDGKPYDGFDGIMNFNLSKFIILIEQIRENDFEIHKKNKTMFFIWKHDIFGISLILTKKDNKSYSSDEYILEGKNWSFSFTWDRANKILPGLDGGNLKYGNICNSEEFKKDYALILLFMDVEEQ